LRIGADDIDAAEFGGRGDTLGVDGEVAVGLGFEEAAEAFVGDRRKFGGASARAVFSRLLSDQG
jgi:hypothetical protein